MKGLFCFTVVYFLFMQVFYARACTLGNSINNYTGFDGVLDTICIGDTMTIKWTEYAYPYYENFSFSWIGMEEYFYVLSPYGRDSLVVVPKRDIPAVWWLINWRAVIRWHETQINTIDSCSTFDETFPIYCLPESRFIADEPYICSNHCVQFSNKSTHLPHTLQWYFEGGTPSTFIGETPPPICYAQAGKFDVRLISLNDAGSDTLLQTDYITVFDAPQEAGNDVLVKPNQGESLVLMPCVIATHYNWYQNDQIICTDCPFYEYTPYGDAHFSCVAYNDTLACATTCHYEIVVQNVKDDLLIPTAFSPNGDGVNDILTPIPFNALLLSLQIYDRWGTLIYDHRDSNAAWQGNYNNMPCEQGTYVYVAEYERLYDHSKQLKKGSVVLIR
jgi:gliding motility-associated-like protein